MSVKTLVLVNENDFLKGYLEKQFDPVYHMAATMHDLCLNEELDIPNREETKERCRKICLEIVTERKNELQKMLLALPKVNQVVKMTPLSLNTKRLVSEYGDIVKVLKITDSHIMVGNKDCEDFMSDLGNWTWGSWLEFNEATYEVIS